MGLCKCPKKKVTNQFCFEHRVNVCEHCMVTNHPKCVVQSYLQWLQDSDYSPVCEICQHDLSLDECVRLVCYHVFHWSCLNHYSSQLPSNTAPAGYVCPTCKTPVCPPNNLVSPVADKLMLKLAQVNWARAGIGLPMLEESLPVSSRSAPDGSNNDESISSSVENRISAPSASSVRDELSMNNSALDMSRGRDGSPSKKGSLANWTSQSSSNAPSTPPTHYPFANIAPSLLTGVFSPKRLYDARDDDHGLGNVSFDHDDNKYRRRSALEWFNRWFKSISSSNARHVRHPHGKMRRYVIMSIIAVIALMTLIVIMTRYGRANADVDPFLDPMANPNIRVLDSNADSRDN